jgi:hypothetical protein
MRVRLVSRWKIERPLKPRINGGSRGGRATAEARLPGTLPVACFLLYY